jgi:tetratricopeptide (TPR) repeat protein
MRRTRTERAFLWQCLSFAFAALLTSTHASAEPAEARTEARSHFDQGVVLARQHAYAEALGEFERAYQIFPHYSVQYNIGQALIALGRPTEAIAALTRYVEEGGANIEPRRRQEVDTAIAGELAKTGSIEVTVDTAGASILIDDKPSGRSPLAAPVRVDSGTHRVLATLDARAGQVAQARIEFGARTSTAPAAVPAPTPASVPAPVPLAASPSQREPPAPAQHSKQKTLAYVVGATGLALTGAAAAHFLWNRARYQDWQSRYAAYYEDPTDQNRESANSLAQSVSNASAVTVGLAIGAGVALGTGAVLLFTSSSTVSASANAGAGGPFMTLRGKF